MPDGRLIDISLELGPATPVFPGDPPVEVEDVFQLGEDATHVSRLETSTHAGTHFDAPAHFIAGGLKAWEIPLERFCGPAWVIELDEAPAIAPGDLEARWPDAPVERLLLKTPNSARWGTPEAAHRVQGLTEASAAWLAARGVGLVGIDGLSIEAIDSETYPVHRALLGREVLILEGLDLTGVAPGPYELLCLPLKLSAPDGAPVRAALRPLEETP